MRCPFCAEEIQDEARICRFCNRDVESPRVNQTETDAETRPAFVLVGLLVIVVLMAVYMSGGGSVKSAGLLGFIESSEVVTLSEFMQLQTGMSYKAVVGVIGQPGVEQARNEIAGVRTVMYGWSNSDGSNMNAMFQQDKLVQKAQFGLR